MPSQEYFWPLTPSVLVDINGNPIVLPGSGTAFQETPAGAINNVNTIFTLTHVPVSNASVQLFLDGLIIAQGVDYTIVGNTITMAIAPNFAQTLYAYYVY